MSDRRKIFDQMPRVDWPGVGGKGKGTEEGGALKGGGRALCARGGLRGTFLEVFARVLRHLCDGAGGRVALGGWRWSVIFQLP